MGKLDVLTGSHTGYFRVGEEGTFPWSNTASSIWYALFVIEDGKICRYGFTPTKSSKESLLNSLKALDPDDEVLLIGIWNGERHTDLFILERGRAIEELEKLRFRK